MKFPNLYLENLFLSFINKFVITYLIHFVIVLISSLKEMQKIRRKEKLDLSKYTYYIQSKK